MCCLEPLLAGYGITAIVPCSNGGQKLKETEADENLAMSVFSPEELPNSEAGKPIEEAEQVAKVES